MLYRLPLASAIEPPSEWGPPLVVVGLTANVGEGDLGYAVDGNRVTRWRTGPQRPGHELTIDLGTAQAVGAVVLSLGPFTYDFPRALFVEVSIDGREWTEAWRGPTASKIVISALQDPFDPRLVLPCEGRRARFVRLRQVGDESTYDWSVSELSVRAPAGSGP